MAAMAQASVLSPRIIAGLRRAQAAYREEQEVWLAAMGELIAAFSEADHQPVVKGHTDLLVAKEVCRADYHRNRANGEAAGRMDWITTYLTEPPSHFRTISHSVQETALRRDLRRVTRSRHK